MDTDWSDLQKWKMDLAKSAITFTVAALASLFLIDHVQEDRARDKARADAYYTSRLKALDDYRAASVSYDLAAHTAYTELYRWNGKIKTAAMLRYEQGEYPRWKLSLETLDHLFHDVKDDLAAQLATAEDRDYVFRRWVNVRLDDEKSDNAKIEPSKTRDVFDQLTAKSACQRAALIAALQSQLFPEMNNDKKAVTVKVLAEKSTEKPARDPCEDKPVGAASKGRSPSR